MGRLKKYLMVVVAAAFALVSIGIGLKYSEARQPKENVAMTATGQEESGEPKKKKGLTGEALFLDDTHVFLAEDITDAYLEVVRKGVDGDEAQIKLVDQAKAKWAIQKALNQLYSKPVLVGSRHITDATLAEGTSEAAKQEVANALSASGINDDFAKLVTEILGKKGTASEHGSSTTGNSTVSLAPNAADSSEVQAAKEQLAHVVENGAVIPGFTMDGYLNAKRAISSVPEGEMKQALLSQLAIVETAMTNMGISYE